MEKIETNEMEINDEDNNFEQHQQHQQMKHTTVPIQQTQLTLKNMWKM